MNSAQDVHRRWTIVGVTAAVAFGAAVRLLGIRRLSFWFDEGYTAWVIDHPARQIIHLISADTAGPLYYLLLHAWSLIFGRSEAALRGMSALFGILSIVLVAAIASRLVKKPAVAIAAAWIFALSWWQIAYSQEARPYELTVFLTAAILYAVLRYLENPCGIWLTAAIAASAAGLYTNNFMPLYIAAIAVAALIAPSPLPMRRRLRDGFIAMLVLTVLYLPWTSALHRQIHRVNSDFWIPPPTLDSVCQELSRMCGIEHFWTWDQHVHRFFSDTSQGVPRTAAAIFLLGVIAAAVRLRGDHRRAALFLLAAALLPLVAAIIYSLLSPSIFLPAGFLPSSLICAIFLAAPLVWCGRWPGRALVWLVLALSAVNLWAFETERTKEDWRSAAAAVAAMPPVPHRLIVFAAPEAQLPFDYYYHLRPGESETGAPVAFLTQDPPRTGLRVLRDSDLDNLRAHLATAKPDDVILVISHAGWVDGSGQWHSEYSDPDGLTARYMLEVMQPVQRFDLPDDSSKHQITIWRLAPR